MAAVPFCKQSDGLKPFSVPASAVHDAPGWAVAAIGARSADNANAPNHFLAERITGFHVRVELFMVGKV